MTKQRKPWTDYLWALAISSGVSIILYVYAALRNDSSAFNYLVWNLILAWIPLLLAIRLSMVLADKLWSSWEAMLTSVLWLFFLPNSFYMITDYIHLQEVVRFDLLYDTLMFTSFIFTGVVLGFTSLVLVHAQLRKRFTNRTSSLSIGLILLLCSFGIYIGRDLRWNSWDFLTNPGGLLFDITDRLTNISAYPQMILTVTTFTVLLISLYRLLWYGAGLARNFDIKNIS